MGELVRFGLLLHIINISNREQKFFFVINLKLHINLWKIATIKCRKTSNNTKDGPKTATCILNYNTRHCISPFEGIIYHFSVLLVILVICFCVDGNIYCRRLYLWPFIQHASPPHIHVDTNLLLIFIPFKHWICTQQNSGFFSPEISPFRYIFT